MPRSGLGAILLLALGLAVTPAASATDRYASPANLGTGDCLSEINSCNLPMAVSGAGGGDDIFVRGDMGDYALSAQLTNPAAIHVHGTRGRPRLIFSGERFTLQSGSSAENLYVELSDPFGDVQLTGSTGDNLIVKNTGHDHAIFMENSTLTNSVAWSPVATGNGEQPIELDQSNTLRNVTAYAPTPGAIAIVAIGRNPPAAGPDTDTFVNVIARGGPGGVGIRLFQDNGVDLTVNIDHSNYSSVEIDPDSDDFTKVHLNLAATNQTAAPLFANPAGGDFHQVSGSPTIDKGVNSVANGATDFDGGARTLNGLTDIGADELIPGSGAAPPPPPSQCTNPATLLVTCADLAGAPGVCSPGLELFPQCLLPVVPRTICNPNQVCSPSTPGNRAATGSCASMGQALPECNVPRREVPTQCAAYGFNLDPLPGQMCWAGAPGAITNCPPPSPAVTPACSFSTTVTTPNAPRASAARVRRRLGRRLTVTIGCPKALADPATKRCKGTIAVDGLRKSLLSTLAKQAEYSAGSYRYFIGGGAAFAGPFQKAANKIAKRVLGGTKLPKAVKTAKIVAELGRSDAHTLSYAASLQRAVKEYRKLAGKTKKRRRSKKSDARVSRSTTTFKRFTLKSGRRRAKIKVRLSAAAVRRLRRDAGKRTQVPLRVIVSFKGTPRPVVRFIDVAVLVR